MEDFSLSSSHTSDKGETKQVLRRRLPIVDSFNGGRIIGTAEAQIQSPPGFFFAAMPTTRTPQTGSKKSKKGKGCKMRAGAAAEAEMSQEDELSDARGTVTMVQGGSSASASGPDQGGSTGPSSGQGPGPSSTREGGSTEPPLDAPLQPEPPDKDKEVVVDSGVTPIPGSASKRKHMAYLKAQDSDTAKKQLRETVPEVPPVPFL
jgi:hypothetical protein